MTKPITVEEARILLRRKREEATIRVEKEANAKKERELADAKAQMEGAIQVIDNSIVDAIQHCQTELKYNSYDQPFNGLLEEHYKIQGFRVKTEFDDRWQKYQTYISWSEQPWPY